MIAGKFKIIFSLFCILGLSFFTNIAEGRDWSDLDEGEHDIFGSEKEKKYPVNAFLIEKEDWANHYSFMVFWLYKNTNYPKYTSFRFLPFYYNLKSKIDNRERTIVPLLYFNRIDGDSELLATPVYYSNINSMESDRSLLYLFWWGRDGTTYKTSYQLFIPFLFYKSDGLRNDNQITDSFWINPLFVSKSNINNDNSYHEYRLNFSLFHFYEYDSDQKSTTWWAPIIPLTYNRTSFEGGHRNFLIFLDYRWEKNDDGDKLKRFYIAPFWFWKSGDDGYNHILPPLYIHSTSQNGESYTHLLPFFIYKNDIKYDYFFTSKSNYKWFIRTSISLFHYRSDEFKGEKKWDGELMQHTEWYPIIPLYYTHTETGHDTHKNLLWLFDWNANSEGKLSRFWFIPFWFEGFGNPEYRHILFPIYASFKWENGEHYRHFLPLLFFNWNSNIKTKAFSGGDMPGVIYKETILSILFCYSGSYAEEQQKEMLNRTFWFPIIPVFYRSTDIKEGSHTNLLWLIDWAGDKDGKMERFWFIPFVFYNTEEAGYKFYFPFYMRPSGNSEERGSSFGIFHYHEWSPEKRIMWAGPAFAWYYPEKKEEYGLLLPIYAAWKSEESQGEILLPWSIHYKDKKRLFYINIFGISKSALFGPLNPELSVDAGTYNGRWYFDTDISWLYEIFRISTRVSINKPWDQNNSDPDLKDNSERGDLSKVFADEFRNKPSLQKKSTLSRETSEFFWGYKILFGWFAYERGDAKRHIRLIPLGWFTWDKDSDDKLYTVPFAFLSYKSQELEYFILFPLFIPIYGSQKEKESYARGFLINAYWDEYNADEKLREQTILWPFINWYNSPQRQGWRLFPFVWHKEHFSGDMQISRNIIIPLLFYSESETDLNGNPINNKVVSLLYYSRKTANTSGISGTTLCPIIPLLYYSSYEKKIYLTEKKTPDNDSKEADNKQSSPKLLSIEYSQVHIIPLLYFSWDKVTVWDNGRDEKESSFVLLGYYSSITKREEKSSLLFGLFRKKNNLTDRSSEIGLLYGLFSYASGKESKCYLIPFWYYYSSTMDKHWNVMLFLDSKSSNNYERFFIFPFWYSTTENENSHSNILGLIDWKRDSKNRLTRSWFLPFYLWYPGEESELYLFTMLSYFGSTPKENTSFIAGLYLYSSEFFERQNFLFLFDHKNYIKEERESYRFLLGTIHYETSKNKTEWELAFGILFDYESYKNSENYKLDFLLFISNWERRGDYWQSSIMPFWYYKENSNGWSLLTPITLSYFSKDKQGDLDLGILGLLYFRNNDIPESSDTRALLGGTLYWERKKPERGYHSYGSLWGILWDYETESETGFSKFTLLKGLFKLVESNGETKYNFLWIL
jgi:hypothetical protein